MVYVLGSRYNKSQYAVCIVVFSLIVYGIVSDCYEEETYGEAIPAIIDAPNLHT